MKEAAAAEALVDREVREFLDWQKARDAVPLLVELRQRAEDIRRRELDKAPKRLGPLTAGAGGSPGGRHHRHRQQAAAFARSCTSRNRRRTATPPSRSA